MDDSGQKFLMNVQYVLKRKEIKMLEQPETLGLRVGEKVKMHDKFGNPNTQKLMKGTSGTLHLTDLSQKDNIISSAWDLSAKTGQVVIVVVKASN